MHYHFSAGGDICLSLKSEIIKKRIPARVIDGNPGRDEKKDERLKQLGVTFLRFDNMEVMHQPDKVLEKIERWNDKNAKK